MNTLPKATPQGREGLSMNDEYTTTFDLLDRLQDGPVPFLHLHPDYVTPKPSPFATAAQLGWLSWDDEHNVFLTARGVEALKNRLRQQQFFKENVWRWWFPLT